MRATLARSAAFLILSAGGQSALAGDESRSSWTSIEVNQLVAVQSKEAYVATAEVSWNPTFFFSNALGLRGDLGLSLFVSSDAAVAEGSKKYVPVYTSQLLLTGHAWEIFGDIGGGLETWSHRASKLTPFAALTANLGWAPRQRIMGLVDRIFVGYSAVFIDGLITREARAGVGVRF